MPMFFAYPEYKRNFGVDFLFAPTEKRQSSVFRSDVFHLYTLALYEMLMTKLCFGDVWLRATSLVI